MVGFSCKEMRPGSRRDFLFLGRNIPNSEKVNPRSEFPKRTFKEERSKPALGRQAAPLQGLTAFGVLRRVSLASAGLELSQDSSLRSE